MSVGAGSIKRAAKAAEGSTETKTVESRTEAKETKSAEGRAEVKETKSAEGRAEVKETKSAEGRAEVKKAKSAKSSTEAEEEKTTKKKASQKPAAGKTSVAGEASGTYAETDKGAASYVAYGVGQELPIYLM